MFLEYETKYGLHFQVQFYGSVIKQPLTSSMYETRETDLLGTMDFW